MNRDTLVGLIAGAIARRDSMRPRTAEPRLRERLQALQAWQAGRLAAEYADQARMTQRRDAAAFFFDDVYGPHDFTRRDAQFDRALRHLCRWLPLPTLEALANALELQALTVELDVAVAERLDLRSGAIDEPRYRAAYRAADRAPDRQRQIELALAIGRRLEELTAEPAIEFALRIAAGPARLAGFGELQSFLERGFTAFRRLGPESGEFLAVIADREAAFMRRMFAADPS